MKRLSIFALLPLLVILTGCRQTPESTSENQVDLSIEVAFDAESLIVGEMAMLVTVLDAAGNPVNDATIAVRGDMSHAGMVPVLAEGQAGVDGVYTIPFEWTMAGDWIVEIVVTLPTGEIASRRFDYTVQSG